MLFFFFYQIHFQLLKLTISDMPFKTKLTSLFNIQGLTDTVRQEVIKITIVTVTNLKLSVWCMYADMILFMKNGGYHKTTKTAVTASLT